MFKGRKCVFNVVAVVVDVVYSAITLFPFPKLIKSHHAACQCQVRD